MASAAEAHPERSLSTDKDDVEHRGSAARSEKGKWERLWPVIACGAGLFSDGYLNNVRLPTYPERQQLGPSDQKRHPPSSHCASWKGAIR